MTRKWLVGVLSVAVLGAAAPLVAAAKGGSLSDWSTYVSSVMTTVTAAAALAAVTLWRAQLRGQSDHDLAKRLGAALRELEDLREYALSALRVLTNDAHPIALELLRQKWLERRDGDQILLQRVKQLENETSALWPTSITLAIDQLRKITEHVVGAVDAHVRRNPLKLVEHVDYFDMMLTGEALSFTAQSSHALLVEWLAQHLHRSSSPMGIDQFQKRTAEIRLETKKREDAEANEAVIARKDLFETARIWLQDRADSLGGKVAAPPPES